MTGGIMNFSIFFTNKCNMNCSYCYEKNKKEQSMDRDTINEVIDFIVQQHNINQNEKVTIVTHGGEPLLEFENIKYLIEKLNTKVNNIHYIITTNATILTDTMIDYIIKHFSEISISIDGIEKAHDANRVFPNGQGTYSTVYPNVKKILTKYNVKARMTINPQTTPYLFENIKHLLNIGFRNIVPVPDMYCNYWTEADINALFEQGKMIIDYIKNYPHITNIGMINDALSKLANAPCNGGLTTFSIDTDGSIYPCLASVGNQEFVLGSVGRGIDQEKVRMISEWDAVNVESCIGCSRYDYCISTRCRIINKLLCGELHTPSPTVCNIENLKVKLSVYYSSIYPTY